MSDSSFYSASSQIRDPSPEKKEKEKEEQEQEQERDFLSPSPANPFGVLYDSNSPSPHRNRNSKMGDNIRHSQIYQEIENRVTSPQRSMNYTNDLLPTSQFSPATPPIITIVDEPKVKRSGSIVSSSASLRNRNRIKSRTKIARKNDLPDSQRDSEDVATDKPKKSKKAKKSSTLFQFPVKRTTSLKRRSSITYNSLGQSTPNFHSQDDMDSFLDYCFSSGTLMVELLPKYMRFFEFRQLIAKRKPDLSYNSKEVRSTELARATLANLEPPPAPPIQLPVKPNNVSLKPSNLVRSAKGKSLNRKGKPKPLSRLSSKRKPKSRKHVTISSPIKESFVHHGYNPIFTTTTAAAAVAEAALGNTPVRNPLLSNAVDYPLNLDIVSNTDHGSIPMTLDPISKLGGYNSMELAQLSPGTIAAVIAAAGMSSLASSSPSLPQSLPTSLSPPMSNNPYTNYRNAFYNSKSKKPLTYPQLFPQVGEAPPNVTRKEIQQMNRTLFLEILLRRTIAAKVGYRLSNTTQRLSSLELNTSDNSSSSEDKNSPQDIKHDIPKLSGSDDSDSDDDSINTNDIIHGKSLVSSDLLPSPQISYSTDFFGNLESHEFPNFDDFLQKSQVSVDLVKKWNENSPPRTHQEVNITGKETTAMEIAAAIGLAHRSSHSVNRKSPITFSKSTTPVAISLISLVPSPQILI